MSTNPTTYPTIDVVIPIFEGVTALDAIGPYDTLQHLPGATVTFIAERTGEHRTDQGFLGLLADATFDDNPHPDVIVVPGGPGTRAIVAEGGPILEWLQSAHQTTTFTTSVCTGSLVLAAAGLLNGMTATTHWGTYSLLEKLGATASNDRVIEHLDERIITAAGVSSGIDMGLRLAELLVDDVAARAMQLLIEYDPQPPFDAGSVEKAGPEVMERLVGYMQSSG